MKNHYVVSLKDKSDGLIHKTRCKSDKDLANLLLHVDDDIYDIVEIVVDNVKFGDYKEFCKKNNSLETGNNE